ncbi:MAG: site-specific integrase [Fibromonadales bacterium]|nr:site-specific integrase [Fibromonadales bacterium]
MAYLFEKTGLIRDRSWGYREISYSVPKQSKSFMRACKNAHETIMGLLPKNKRQTITAKEMKQIVLQYVNLDEESRCKIIAQLVLPYNSGVEALGSHTLKELFDIWKTAKQTEGLNKGGRFDRLENTLFTFFNLHHLKTTNDFTFHTAHDFVNWRTKTRYKKGGTVTSASVVKKELDILKQMVKLAVVYGWYHNGNIWDSVKVKAVVGLNKKVVEPLDIEEQKKMLNDLKHTHEGCHDLALFLLITGMRLGELNVIKPDSIKNDLISLHGDFIGNHRTTGKTKSANRNIPVCKTIRELFKRGHIFNTTGNALSIRLKRFFKGIHPHKLRHTFAVNKLLSGEELQKVSYQMGHAGIQITADNYGKYEHKHFKVGFEQTKTERKNLLKWLEEDYFI